MKDNRSRSRAVRVGFLALTLAALIGPVGPVRAVPQSPDHPPAVDLSPADVPARIAFPKLQSSLARLAAVAESRGSQAAAEFAALRRMPWVDGRVRVVAVAVNGGLSTLAVRAAAHVRTRVQDLGGTFEASHDARVQALVPASALRDLAADPSVSFVRLPLRPFKQAYVSEGVSRTGADKWRSLAAFRNGTPTKIAIMDIGFDGYRSLLGKELPAKVTTRSFRADGDLTGGGEIHGAACAEIVYDMAPNAELYLVNVDTDVEQDLAVDWLNGQGVQVISYSLGWLNAGAGDGTGPVDDDLAASDARWAVSAGNGALDHWDGSFSDPDADGWLNFAPGDELLEFYVPAYETVGAFLNWKDWGVYNGVDYSGSNQDYDLYLYHWNGSAYVLVDTSTGDQTGSQWPTEEIYGWYSSATSYWAVAVRKYSANRAVPLELFTIGNSRAIEYNVPARSLGVPGDSPYALTAGASDASSDVYHSYSAQGPTWDGRMKPDFAAPSGVSTSSYGSVNFYGTSASAPHLAGALGLLKGGTPYTMDQIVAILKNRAVDLGDPGPDYKFGIGRLNVKKR